MTIYVGNLPEWVGKADLEKMFVEYGPLKQVVLFPSQASDYTLADFALIEMAAEAHEELAVASLDGAELMGHLLRVSKTRPRVMVDRIHSRF